MACWKERANETHVFEWNSTHVFVEYDLPLSEGSAR